MEKKNLNNSVRFSRVTPDKITFPEKSQVIVFGSNESGKHRAGAARLAFEMWGALAGQGFGLMGDCFAIPTKDWKVETLPLGVIKMYVERFLDFAKQHPEKQFLVTRIGCGLAGYMVTDIAPLFLPAVDMVNVSLPKEFWEYIKGYYAETVETVAEGTKTIPVLEDELNKDLWDIKQGSCPPEKGTCPMMYYAIPAGQKAFCPSCNKWVNSTSPTF